jgi:hypothetical protein
MVKFEWIQINFPKPIQETQKLNPKSLW